MKADKTIAVRPGDWSFGDDGVAAAFQQHIERSVPFYHEGHALICQLSDFFALPDSVVYELGCSAGLLLRRLFEHNRHKRNIQWIGLDKEEQMIRLARQAAEGRPEDQSQYQDLSQGQSQSPSHTLADMPAEPYERPVFLCEDILHYSYAKADMFIAYYAMQFIRERHRQALFNTIYQRLHWGGAFVLFEKVGAPDARFQDMMTTLYREHKQARGFTAAEALGKERSLKGVLRPFSSQGNIDLLRRSGFSDIMTVMKYVCFEGFLAIK